MIDNGDVNVNGDVARAAELARRVIAEVQERGFTSREFYLFARMMEDVGRSASRHSSEERRRRIDAFGDALSEELANRPIAETVARGYDPNATLREVVDAWIR